MRRSVRRRRAVDAEMSADDSQKPAHKPVGNLIIGSFSIGPCARLGVCPLLALLRLNETSDLSPQSAAKQTRIKLRSPTSIFEYTSLLASSKFERLRRPISEISGSSKMGPADARAQQ